MGTARILVNADNFDRSDGAVGANWTNLNTFAGSSVQIISNQIKGGGGTVFPGEISMMRWVGAGTFAADQYAKLIVTGYTWTAGAAGVICRCSADADANRDYYFYAVQDNNGLGTQNRMTTLGKCVNGSNVTLASGNVSWAEGDSIEIEAIGTTIRGLKNGVVQHSAIDGVILSGQPGVLMMTAAPKGDNWEGGSLLLVSDLISDPATFTGLGTVTANLAGTGYLAISAAGTSTMTQSQNIATVSSVMAGTGTMTSLLGFPASMSCFMYGGWASGNVVLAWDANTESDLAGYRIYIGTSSGVYNYATSPYVSPVNVGLVTTFTILGLTGPTTYYFAITAYNTTGGESAFSSELAWTVADYGVFTFTLKGVNTISGSAAGTSQLLGTLVNVGQLILMLDLDTGGIGSLSAFGLAAKAGAMSAFPNLGAVGSTNFTLYGNGDLGNRQFVSPVGTLTGSLGGTTSLSMIPGTADGTSDLQGIPSLTGSMTMVITGQGTLFSRFSFQTGNPDKQYRTRIHAGEVHRSKKR